MTDQNRAAVRAKTTLALGNLLAIIATESSEHPWEGSEKQKEAWDEVKRRFRELEAEVVVLREAIEEYLLWEPGKQGHAEAHRKLQAALGGRVSA